MADEIFMIMEWQDCSLIMKTDRPTKQAMKEYWQVVFIGIATALFAMLFRYGGRK